MIQQDGAGLELGAASFRRLAGRRSPLCVCLCDTRENAITINN
jgi:hypothetical protein